MKLISKCLVRPKFQPLWLIVLLYRVKREWGEKQYEGNVEELHQIKKFIYSVLRQHKEPYDKDCRVYVEVDDVFRDHDGTIISDIDMTVYRNDTPVVRYYIK
jgi:hypothetical protein